jgi:chaperonin GroEL (HSP60 family)
VTADGDRLFGDGVLRSSGDQARRYNLLAARLIADLVKGSMGPRGLDKMFTDIMGEVTVTKDGATFLRKIDVEHPAARVLIEASNAVDNEVGDGTTSVVVLAGALLQKAEELLDMGIAPSTIADGYSTALGTALKALSDISRRHSSEDRDIMLNLVNTCLQSKVLADGGDKIANLLLDAVCLVARGTDDRPFEPDDIKIEEKQGTIGDIELVKGVVIDKTVDSSAMPKLVENARIVLVDEELEGKRTRTDAEIRISSPGQLGSFSDAQTGMVRSKVEHIIDSGANVVFSRKGINTFAQHMLTKAGIISVRRVKENDLIWLSKATGASITSRLDHDGGHHDHAHEHHHAGEGYHHGDIEFKLGFAERVCERQVGDDRMVFVEGCVNPKAVTLLLRASSKGLLDECHRSTLDAISVLRDFMLRPFVVPGGGATEAAVAKAVRKSAKLISGREQIVIQKFADALEEIPLTIAGNSGMDLVDTLVSLRADHSNSSPGVYGVDAIERRVKEMLPSVIEPLSVKEQVIKTAAEVAILLVRVDDVLMAKPRLDNTHTHADGTKHSHAGGTKEHQHDYFDRLGREQRPKHHYY